MKFKEIQYLICRLDFKEIAKCLFCSLSLMVLRPYIVRTTIFIQLIMIKEEFLILAILYSQQSLLVRLTKNINLFSWTIHSLILKEFFWFVWNLNKKTRQLLNFLFLYTLITINQFKNRIKYSFQIIVKMNFLYLKILS